MTTISLWSHKLEAGKPYFFTLFEQLEAESLILKLTNASLGLEVADENARTALKITYNSVLSPSDSDSDEDEKKEKKDDEDSEGETLKDIIVCVLTPGKTEQAQLNLECGSELLKLEAVGKNDIYLSGFIVDQEMDHSDDSDIDSDEEAFHLDEVSSDVEFSADDAELSDEEGAGRFEEIDDDEDAKKKSLKRGADAMDEDAAPSNGLSKKQQKKLNKKLKGENGEAVAPASTASAKSDAAKPASKKEDKKGDKKEKKDEKEKKDKPAGAGPKTLPGGLIIQDTKVGEGRESKKGDTLGMRYIGKLENGKVFDSNKGGAPFTFRIGTGEVIKGWDQGLLGMKVGGERIITVPAPLGYGKKGSKPDIPPNATLRFEVKLVDLK